MNEWYEKGEAISIADQPECRDICVNVLVSMHKYTKEEATLKHQKEAYLYRKAFENDSYGDFKKVPKLHLFNAFLCVFQLNLSLEAGTKSECYLTANKVSQNGTWVVKSASLCITGYGELSIRLQKGQLKEVQNPVIVYEGDLFEYGSNNHSKYVNHKSKKPRSTKIIGGFVWFQLGTGSWDCYIMELSDIDKLAKAKFKKDKDMGMYASVNGGIDPALLSTKLLKHFAKALPKTSLPISAQPEIIDEETEDEVETKPVVEGVLIIDTEEDELF